MTYPWILRNEFGKSTLSTESIANVKRVLAVVGSWMMSAKSRPSIPGATTRRDTLTIRLCLRDRTEPRDVDIIRWYDRKTFDVEERIGKNAVEYNLVCVSVEAWVNSLCDPQFSKLNGLKRAAISISRGADTLDDNEFTSYLINRFCRVHAANGIGKYTFLDRVINAGYHGILVACILA